MLNGWRVDLALLHGPRVNYTHHFGFLDQTPEGDFWEQTRCFELTPHDKHMLLAQKIIGFPLRPYRAGLVWCTGFDEFFDWRRNGGGLRPVDAKRALHDEIAARFGDGQEIDAAHKPLMEKVERLLCIDCPLPPERLEGLRERRRSPCNRTGHSISMADAESLIARTAQGDFTAPSPLPPALKI